MFAPHHFPTRVPPPPSFIWPLMPCNPLKISKLHVFYCLSYEHLTNNKNTFNLLNISILNILCAVAKKIKIKTDRICAYYYITYFILFLIVLFYYIIIILLYYYYTYIITLVILLYLYYYYIIIPAFNIISSFFIVIIILISTYYIYCK